MSIVFTGDKTKVAFSLSDLARVEESVGLGGNTVFGGLKAAIDDAQKLQAAQQQPLSPLVDHSLVTAVQQAASAEPGRSVTHVASKERASDTGRKV